METHTFLSRDSNVPNHKVQFIPFLLRTSPEPLSVSWKFDRRGRGSVFFFVVFFDIRRKEGIGAATAAAAYIGMIFTPLFSLFLKTDLTNTVGCHVERWAGLVLQCRLLGLLEEVEFKLRGQEGGESTLIWGEIGCVLVMGISFREVSTRGR